MNPEWNRSDPDPTPADFDAWADGELNRQDAGRVEAWLAAHPDEAARVELDRRLLRLFRDHSAPDPSPAAWQNTLERIEKKMAVPAADPTRSRVRPYLPLLAAVVAAAALVGTVVLARSLWPTLPSTPPPVAVQTNSGDDEPFPVATASEVNIIRMDVRDADRVVMEQPLLDSFDLAAPEDIEIVRIDPDPDEGRIPQLRRGSRMPMIVVRADDE